MSTSTLSKPLLSLREAAQHLGCSANTLRRIVDRSRAKLAGQPTDGPTIKFWQLGPHGSIRFRPEWIEEFIDAGTLDPAQGVPLPKRRAPKPCHEALAIPEVPGFNSALLRL